MNFNYGFVKKDPKQPVMAESLKHIKIQQPDIEAFIDNENDFLAITRARISAQVADISDKAIYQAIIDYATKAGLTDVYLIDEKFIRDAIVTKVTKDVGVEALKMKINDLEEELQTVYRDYEDAEERDNVKALTIDELSKKIDELKKRNAYLEGVRLGAKHLQDKLYDDIHAIAEERDTVIEKNGVLAKRIGELEDIVSRFSNDKVIREKEIKKLQEELAHRDKQNEELFKENKAFESMLSKAEQQRDFYMRRTYDYDRLKEHIAKLDKQIDKYDLVIHTIEQLFGCAFDI